MTPISATKPLSPPQAGKQPGPAQATAQPPTWLRSSAAGIDGKSPEAGGASAVRPALHRTTSFPFSPQDTLVGRQRPPVQRALPQHSPHLPQHAARQAQQQVPPSSGIAGRVRSAAAEVMGDIRNAGPFSFMSRPTASIVAAVAAFVVRLVHRKTPTQP